MGRRGRYWYTASVFCAVCLAGFATDWFRGFSQKGPPDGLPEATQRKLLGFYDTEDLAYSREDMGVAAKKCILREYCQADDCKEDCDDDGSKCIAYVVDPSGAGRPRLCESIIDEEFPTRLPTGVELYRKPGAPCLLGDWVQAKGVNGTVLLANDYHVAIRHYGINTTTYHEIGDVDRISSAGIHTCDPEPAENRMYPPEAFSKRQLKHGAIILHALGVLYVFFGLAIVCDDYFVPALEAITVKLRLSDDVAGATFMAAGGSAPELFTSVIGVFIAESDIGFGTIIGSAVFNVLFVIGACSLATREMAQDIGGLPLTWWPLARDSTFYLVDLVVLMIFFTDKKIAVWESLVLLLLYASYVVFMSQNVLVYSKVRSFLDQAQSRVAPEPQQEGKRASIANEEAGKGLASERQRKRSNSTSAILTRRPHHGGAGEPNDVELVPGSSGKEAAGDNVHREKSARSVSQDAEGEEEEEDEGWSPRPPDDGLIKWLILFPLNFPLWLTLPSGETLGNEKDMFEREIKLTALADLLRTNGLLDEGAPPTLPPVEVLQEKAQTLVPEGPGDLRGDDDEETDAADILKDLIDSFKSSAHTGHALAAAFLKWQSHEDPTSSAVYGADMKEQYGKLFGCLFAGGFLGSILWIGGFTYLMVWWAETIGKTLGISEVVMGITVLAAGTSVPDLISSVIVARDGKGDMAVSSSIGSNIFDATFGLPLPWFLYSLAHGGEAIEVKAKALGSSVLMLVAMLLSVIASVAALGWRLNIKLGLLSLVNYTIFLTITILMSYDKIPTAF